MYLEGNGLRGTGRILGGSNATRLNWIKQFGGNIKESVLGNMPHEIPDLEIVEIDERWHCTVKKRKLWVWIAIARFDQQIMADTVGGRRKKVWKRLLG